MAKIQSGNSSDELIIDSVSKAARITLYDTAGRVLSAQSKQTFSVSTALFTPAATATDIFIIKGSATKTIRIISLEFMGTATAATLVDLFLIKRSTANTTGTYVEGTAAKHDSQNSGNSNSAGHYTANPGALGTSAGTVKRVKALLTTSATVMTGLNKNQILTPGLDQPITLRGVAESLALNFNGAALPAGSADWSINCTWIEE